MQQLPWEAIVGGLMAVITFVVWLVRLEAKSLHTEKMQEIQGQELRDVKLKMELLDSSMVKELTEIKVSLAKIEGALGVKKYES